MIVVTPTSYLTGAEQRTSVGVASRHIDRLCNATYCYRRGTLVGRAVTELTRIIGPPTLDNAIAERGAGVKARCRDMGSLSYVIHSYRDIAADIGAVAYLSLNVPAPALEHALANVEVSVTIP